MSRRVNIDEVAAEDRLKLQSIRSALLKIEEVRPAKVIWGETATWFEYGHDYNKYITFCLGHTRQLSVSTGPR